MKWPLPERVEPVQQPLPPRGAQERGGAEPAEEHPQQLGVRPDAAEDRDQQGQRVDLRVQHVLHAAHEAEVPQRRELRDLLPVGPDRQHDADADAGIRGGEEADVREDEQRQAQAERARHPRVKGQAVRRRTGRQSGPLCAARRGGDPRLCLPEQGPAARRERDRASRPRPRSRRPAGRRPTRPRRQGDGDQRAERRGEAQGGVRRRRAGEVRFRGGAGAGLREQRRESRVGGVAQRHGEEVAPGGVRRGGEAAQQLAGGEAQHAVQVSLELVAAAAAPRAEADGEAGAQASTALYICIYVNPSLSSDISMYITTYIYIYIYISPAPRGRCAARPRGSRGRRAARRWGPQAW